MTPFPHLATRLFNVPLAIAPGKAEIVMAALADRLGIARLFRANGEAVALAQGAYVVDEDDRAAPHAARGYDVAGGVAVIPIVGTLVQKLGTLRPYSGMTGYDGIRQNFLMALTDPDVKGIMFDIDSPGGEVAGCFDLVDTIYAARGDKPIWAVLNENAMSAGFALASAADRITVPRTGLAGSIGVICMHIDFSQALAKEGIEVTFITYGARKADFASEKPLSDAARKLMQDQVDTTGELFVATVARNRGLSTETVRGTEAGFFQGADALRLGLVDQIAAPDAAFRSLVASLD